MCLPDVQHTNSLSSKYPNLNIGIHTNFFDLRGEDFGGPLTQVNTCGYTSLYIRC